MLKSVSLGILGHSIRCVHDPDQQDSEANLLRFVAHAVEFLGPFKTYGIFGLARPPKTGDSAPSAPGSRSPPARPVIP